MFDSPSQHQYAQVVELADTPPSEGAGLIAHAGSSPALRTIDSSPQLYYIRGDDLTLGGGSVESQATLQGGFLALTFNEVRSGRSKERFDSAVCVLPPSARSFFAPMAEWQT